MYPQYAKLVTWKPQKNIAQLFVIFDKMKSLYAIRKIMGTVGNNEKALYFAVMTFYPIQLRKHKSCQALLHSTLP